MAKAKPNTPPVTVTALVPVNYDGTDYAAGEQLDVRPDDLPQLLNVAAVEPVPVPDESQAPAA